MRVITSLPLLTLANFALGHGDHGHGGPAAGEAMQDYAKRHVRILHTGCALVLILLIDGFGASHVNLRPPFIIANLKYFGYSDSFDVRSFFKLHDLNGLVPCS